MLREDGDQLVIPPGQFALLLSDEVVSVPPTAIGFISIKSSFKLHGLINVSGFHVDPGFSGRLMFSVYNAGGSDVLISRGQRLFLMWFASLESQTEDVYEGSRLAQDMIPNKDIMAIGREHYSPAAVNDRLTAVEVRSETAWRLAIAAFGSLIVAMAIFVAQTLTDTGDTPNDPPPPTAVVTSTSTP